MFHEFINIWAFVQTHRLRFNLLLAFYASTNALYIYEHFLGGIILYNSTEQFNEKKNPFLDNKQCENLKQRKDYSRAL